MKSLQVVTPSEPCIYHCPFCISKTHRHFNRFKNVYQEDFQKWKTSLEQVLEENKDLKTVVITGTNEPMQTPKCVKDILDIVRAKRKDVTVEIQTRRYLPSRLYEEIDIVAYSIASFSLLDKIEVCGKKARYVIILTDSFSHKSLQEILANIPDTVSQVTFKVLQESIDGNTEVDKWIQIHKADDETVQKLKEDISNYHGTKSILFDECCMNAKARYEIFRCDGKVYKDWDEVK